MTGLNKVTLIGNVGKDPLLNLLENGSKVAKITLATTDSYKDSHGQKHKETEWHNIVLWQALAELAENYIKKGSMLYIEGKLKTRSFQDKEGIKRYVTEILADQVILLDKPTHT
jgi:single-strand DNA-binding protein